MAIDEVTINDCPLLIEQLAEGMAIQAGAMDDTKYLPAAKEFQSNSALHTDAIRLTIWS